MKWLSALQRFVLPACQRSSWCSASGEGSSGVFWGVCLVNDPPRCFCDGFRCGDLWHFLLWHIMVCNNGTGTSDLQQRLVQ